MKELDINFGILIDLNINNKCHLQDFNILELFNRIDVYHYIYDIDCGYEDLQHFTDNFKEDAEKISALDSSGQKTEYYLICYIKDDNDNVLTTKKIKQLFY